MDTKKKVVCPKCAAKLTFDPDKITSDVARFKCPACKTVLRIRKPTPKQEKPASNGKQVRQPAGPDPLEAGEELMKLARKFEAKMGFDANEQESVPEVEEQEELITENKEEVTPETPEKIEGDTTRVYNARKSKRVKFKKKVLVDNQIMVEALDISDNGLFLHTGRSFEDGAIVEVGIPTMPGNFDLKVQARVQHNHRGIGMGMQFIDLDEKQKAELNKLISSLDAEAHKELEGRKKILLVGGTDTARNINKSKLVMVGFYVMQATTANEVFKILQEEPPDAMILEWQDTQFHCKGLLAQIKKNPQYDAIIRVVLSALTDSFIHREIMDA